MIISGKKKRASTFLGNVEHFDRLRRPLLSGELSAARLTEGYLVKERKRKWTFTYRV